MKKIIFSILALSSLSFANMDSVKEVTVNFMSFRTYYACSYAENQTRTYLQAMGADVKSVRCIGGIQHHELDNSLRIKAKYVMPAATNAEQWISVNLKGRESCDLNTKIIDTLMNEFQVRNTDVQKRCMDANGRFSYSFQVLAQ